MYRYWDGSAWSAALSSSPHAAPPSQGLVPGSGQQSIRPGQPGTYGGQTGTYGGPAGFYGGQAGSYGGGTFGGQTGAYGSRTGQDPAARYAPTPTAPRRSKGWIVALVAVGVVVAVLIGLAVRAVSDLAGGGPGGNPGGQPSAQICPEELDPSTEPGDPKPADGRVHGGALSYPQLGAPWEAPRPDNRVPFGRDVMHQTAFVEEYPEGQWVASVLVGELIAGDGFFTPEQGAEIVVECVVGVFYGSNTEVTRDDQVSKATTLDGKDAWLIESHLTFDIPGLEAKGETLILMIVATGDATASLFYASIPDTSPQFMQPARDALAELRVDG